MRSRSRTLGRRRVSSFSSTPSTVMEKPQKPCFVSRDLVIRENLGIRALAPRYKNRMPRSLLSFHGRFCGLTAPGTGVLPQAKVLGVAAVLLVDRGEALEVAVFGGRNADGQPEVGGNEIGGVETGQQRVRRDAALDHRHAVDAVVIGQGVPGPGQDQVEARYGGIGFDKLLDLVEALPGDRVDDGAAQLRLAVDLAVDRPQVLVGAPFLPGLPGVDRRCPFAQGPGAGSCGRGRRARFRGVPCTLPPPPLSSREGP